MKVIVLLNLNSLAAWNSSSVDGRGGEYDEEEGEERRESKTETTLVW